MQSTVHHHPDGGRFQAGFRRNRRRLSRLGPPPGAERLINIAGSLSFAVAFACEDAGADDMTHGPLPYPDVHAVEAGERADDASGDLEPGAELGELEELALKAIGEARDLAFRRCHEARGRQYIADEIHAKIEAAIASMDVEGLRAAAEHAADFIGGRMDSAFGEIKTSEDWEHLEHMRASVACDLVQIVRRDYLDRTVHVPSAPLRAVLRCRSSRARRTYRAATKRAAATSTGDPDPDPEPDSRRRAPAMIGGAP